MKTSLTFIKIKFFYFFIVCLCLAFTSCKKETFISQGNIFATVDSVDLNLSTSANAQLYFDANLKAYVLFISGHAGEADKTIFVSVDSKSPITNGSYLSTSSFGSNELVQITYWDGTDANPHLDVSDGSGTYPTNVTITSISSTNIKGTFNGTLTSPTIKVVANGKFDVPITQ